jgi:hypothetical protein
VTAATMADLYVGMDTLRRALSPQPVPIPNDPCGRILSGVPEIRR